MRQIFYFLFLIIFIAGCFKKTSVTEDPNTIAREYCTCIENQFANAKDSSLDIKECENKVYAKSRLLTIYLDFDHPGNYSVQTNDSAVDFAVRVRDIEQSSCMSKIDFKKIKPVR